MVENKNVLRRESPKNPKRKIKLKKKQVKKAASEPSYVFPHFHFFRPYLIPTIYAIGSAKARKNMASVAINGGKRKIESQLPTR